MGFSSIENFFMHQYLRTDNVTTVSRPLFLNKTVLCSDYFGSKDV